MAAFTKPLASSTFARSLGTSGSTFQMTANGGGFSASGNPLTVNIGDGAALDWGTTVGSQLVGTLKFGCSLASNATTFQNAVNLNGADRTIYTDDNPTSANDIAIMSGVISNGVGTAGLVKTGPGVLSLTELNTYNGVTTIGGGTLKVPFWPTAARPVRLASPRMRRKTSY